MKMDSTELAALYAVSKRADIPYAELKLSKEYQARRPGELKDDPEVLSLKATIQAIGGLLHNLVVVECADGGYEVCAGGRRWTALGLLVQDGVLPDSHPVPCLVIPADMARFASLIENEQRKAMHPADVFTTYAKLRADGWTIQAIATAHGAAELSVKKLLALGSVSPVLMELFRRDKIDMPTMQALASVSDYARQEAAWKAASGGYYHKPSAVRQFLAQTEMRGDSAVARYVTVAAYEKAGGAVRRDLFAQRGEDAYLDDPQKVAEMAVEKMQRSKLAKEVNAEGWGWVEYRVGLDHDELRRFGRVQEIERAPTKAEAKQLAKLEKAYDTLARQYAAFEEDPEADEDEVCKVYEQLEAAEMAVDRFKCGLYGYPDDLKPLAGVILHLDYQGDLTATRGLIRQEERDAVSALVKRDADEPAGSAGAGVDLPPAKTRPVHSEALTNRLQAQRVIALQAEVMVRPNLALCLLVEQMLGDLDWNRRSASGDTFDFSARSAHHELSNTDPDIKDCAAWATVQEQIELVTKDVPEDDGAVLPWLLAQSQTDVIAMLAVLSSVTIYRRRSGAHSAETEHLDRLSSIVDLDMSKWWQPTAQSYLAHVSKDRIAAVVAQEVGKDQAQSLLTMKKAQAAATAEELLKGKGWVPGMMRTQTSRREMAVEHPMGEMEE